MIVRVLDAAAPEWAEFLGETPHDFYHLPACAELCAIHEGGEACALRVDDGSRSVLLPLILRPIPGSDRRDATSPYGYPGPLVRGTGDAHFLADALASGFDALRRDGIVSVFVRFHPLLNADLPAGVGELVVHGHTVGIDLSQSEAALWAQTRRNHRRDIKRAVASGCVAAMDPGFARFGVFKRLYRATMERRHASPYYLFDDDYFDGLRDALGDSLHLCVVEQGEDVIAASLFVETCGIVQHHLTGTSESPAQAEASKLLVHFARGWARERGNSWLHLGGGVGGADDSLLHFKAGFSPARYPFATLRAILDEDAYSDLVRVQAGAPGPTERGGFFPAYRTE